MKFLALKLSSVLVLALLLHIFSGVVFDSFWFPESYVMEQPDGRKAIAFCEVLPLAPGGLPFAPRGLPFPLYDFSMMEVVRLCNLML